MAAAGRGVLVIMDTVDISVLLIVRNAATLLPKTLAHLEHQSYPSGKFEIVVLDRASVDSTHEIAMRQAEGSPVKIRIFRNELPGIGAARNAAIQESRGRWVLFFESSLLASPKCVEQHVRAQDLHGGACAIVGNIERHPQSGVDEFVGHHAFSDMAPFTDNQPLRFIDWRCWNLSLPRAAVLDANGFDESFVLPGLEDVELAWRLERAGIHGFYSKGATAYFWQPLSVAEEIARRYSEGFTLWQAMEKTRSDVLANRYRGSWGRTWIAAEFALAPLYEHICRVLKRNTRPFDWVHRRLSRSAAICGYLDASQGRPPRLRGDSAI